MKILGRRSGPPLTVAWFDVHFRGVRRMNLSRSDQRLTDLTREAPLRAVREFPRVRLAETARASAAHLPAAGQFDSWRDELRVSVLGEIAEFVSARCADEL